MLENIHNRLINEMQERVINKSTPINENKSNIDSIQIDNTNYNDSDAVIYYDFKLTTNISSIEYILSCNRWEYLIHKKDTYDYDYRVDEIKNIKKYHDRSIINIINKSLTDYIERNNIKAKTISHTDIIYKYCRIFNDTLIICIIDDIMIAHILYMLLKDNIKNIILLKMRDLLSYSIIEYEIDDEYINNIKTYYYAMMPFFNDDTTSEFINDEKCINCGFINYCKNNTNSINQTEESDNIAQLSNQGVIFN